MTTRLAGNMALMSHRISVAQYLFRDSYLSLGRPPEDRVQAITHCKDTYTVMMANGQTHKFWERNLRLNTDASGDGPEQKAPALVGAGMMHDAQT